MMLKDIFVVVISLALANSQVFTNPYPAYPPIQPVCPAKQCCSFKTISVQGSGKVSGLPDIARLSVTLQVNALNTELAIAGLSDQVAKVIDILKQNGLDSSAYSATSVEVYANTSWSTGKQVILGQIAS